MINFDFLFAKAIRPTEPLHAVLLLLTK